MAPISRLFLGLGAAMLLLATAFGAYGTHALAARLTATAWSAYSTAVDYQFYHGLGLVAVAILTEICPGRRPLYLSGWLMLVGIVLFCGSIYATTLGAPPMLGAAAPIGGTALMAAWLALISAAWASGRRSADALA